MPDLQQCCMIFLQISAKGSKTLWFWTSIKENVHWAYAKFNVKIKMSAQRKRLPNDRALSILRKSLTVLNFTKWTNEKQSATIFVFKCSKNYKHATVTQFFFGINYRRIHVFESKYAIITKPQQIMILVKIWLLCVALHSLFYCCLTLNGDSFSRNKVSLLPGKIALSGNKNVAWSVETALRALKSKCSCMNGSRYCIKCMNAGKKFLLKNLRPFELFCIFFIIFMMNTEF